MMVAQEGGTEQNGQNEVGQEPGQGQAEDKKEAREHDKKSSRSVGMKPA
jgi:hypothetical protein